MLSSSNKKGLINDLAKNACIMTVVMILTNSRAGSKKLIDENSVNAIIMTLLAFVFYWVVFINFVPPLV